MAAPESGCGSTCFNPGGEFDYPPGIDGLSFNYADTVRAEWTTTYEDSNDCELSMWYWQNPDDGWLLSSYTPRSVDCNGTEDVPLNLVSDAYWGQLNLNHTFPNGSYNLFLSGWLDVGYNPDQDGRLWTSADSASDNTDPTNTQDLTTITSAPAESTNTGNAPMPVGNSGETQSAEPDVSAISAPSSGGGGSLSAGAIAGIVIGAIMGIIILFTVGFLAWRRRKRAKDRAAATVPLMDSYYAPVKPEMQKMNGANAIPVEKSATERNLRAELPPATAAPQTQAPVELAGDERHV